MPGASQPRGVMVGQLLCSYTAHVAVCSFVPNKKWWLWKVSLTSAHHKRTCTTQTKKYLNSTPSPIRCLGKEKKKKKKIKIFSNKSATLKSTITPVLHNSFANFGCDEDYHGFSLTLAPPPIDSYLWISEAVPLHISQLLLLVKNVVVSATLLFSWIQNRAWTNPKRLGLLVVTNYNSFETTSGSGYPWTADVEKLGEDIKRKDHFLCALFLILLSYSSHTGCFPRQNNGPKGYLIRLSSAALMAALPHLEEECCFSL